MNLKSIILVVVLSTTFSVQAQTEQDYYNSIRKVGKEPTAFIAEKIKAHDLIIFDDALHSAVEPFEFYCTYLSKNPKSVDYVFLEIIPISAQPHIDSFLNNSIKDTALLEEVFQQDVRYGWPYETYLNLFSVVWDINQQLPKNDIIRIIGVGQPIYWEGLHSREDYNVYQQSLLSRDNFMYNTILKYMDEFRSNKKGIFLTNTRHAYKCIKKEDSQIYWNTGTFFYQWHPGRTYSVRFHNMILNIEATKKDTKNSSTEGLDRLVYSWVRMGNGLWDKVFAKNGNKPVAIPFKDNIFGQHPYIGNHMTNALPGQTMYDSYDALIFLKPLEETKFSAHTNFFYTNAFKKEVEHRVRVIHEHDLDKFLKENNVSSVSEYIEKLAKYVPEKPNSFVR